MNAEADVELVDVKVGGRRLHVGDEVKIRGLRGMFTIKGFRDTPGGIEVSVFGGPAGGVRMWRTVTVDRIGVRRVVAA